MPFPLRLPPLPLSCPPALSALRTRSRPLAPHPLVASHPCRVASPPLALVVSLFCPSVADATSTRSCSLPSPASLGHSTSLSLARSLARLSLPLPSLIFLPPLWSYLLASLALPNPFQSLYHSLSHSPLTHCVSLSLSRSSLFLRDRIVYVLRAGIAARNCPSHSDAVCSLPARSY